MVIAIYNYSYNRCNSCISVQIKTYITTLFDNAMVAGGYMYSMYILIYPIIQTVLHSLSYIPIYSNLKHDAVSVSVT